MMELKISVYHASSLGICRKCLFNKKVAQPSRSSVRDLVGLFNSTELHFLPFLVFHVNPSLDYYLFVFCSTHRFLFVILTNVISTFSAFVLIFIFSMKTWVDCWV